MHCRLPLPPYHCRPDITPPWVGPTLNRRWHASYCADTDTLALLTDKTKQASEAHRTAAEAAATINRLQVEQVSEPAQQAQQGLVVSRAESLSVICTAAAINSLQVTPGKAG